MHCQLCGHGPVINGVCGACHGRPGHPSPHGPVQYGPAPYGRAPGIPPLLWLPVGAFVLTAFVGFITFVSAVSGVVAESNGYGSAYTDASAYGLYAGTISLIVAVGAALVAIRLLARRPAARAFAMVGAIVLLLCAMFDGLVRSAATVLPALLCVAAAVMLAVSPGLRAAFAPPGVPAPRLPTSIVVTRTILLVTGIATALNALGYLGGAVLALAVGASASRAGGELGSLFGGTFGAIGGFALVGALFLGGFAALLLWARKGIGSGSRAARVVVTVVAGLDLVAVLFLVALGFPTTLWLAGFLFSLVAAGALWFPADARRFFGEPPLPAVEQARGAVIGIPRYLPTIATTTPPPGPSVPPIPAPRAPAPPHPCGGVVGSVPAPSGGVRGPAHAPSGVSGAAPVPSGAVSGRAPVPSGVSATTAVATGPTSPHPTGRHAAREGSPASFGSGATAAPEPPTERFAAVTASDEPTTQPVPVVGPAGDHRSAGTET